MRLFLASIFLVPLATVLPATTSLAQLPPVSVGMPVVDVSGGAVGTVKAINGDNLIVKTDKYEVALPRNSFTLNGGKLFFGMTQAALNAATEATLAESAAKSAAMLVVGAEVKGTAGTKIGSIESLDADFAIIKLESGRLVRVPRSGIAGRSDGVVIGMTAEQLEAQVASSGEASK